MTIWKRARAVLGVALMCCGAPFLGLAQATNETAAPPADTNLTRAQIVLQVCEAARTDARNMPASFEHAWKLGRACFDLADVSADDKECDQASGEGIAACRRAIELQPRQAAGYYYLGMNLGQSARVHRISALRLVEQMEKLFKEARRLDPAFDYHGPDRNLGLLYQQTPSWPVSIGSRNRARQYLGNAISGSPLFPENHLNLIEAQIEWSSRDHAVRQFQKLQEVWPSARTNFTGAAWTSAWEGWEKRFQSAQEELQEDIEAAARKKTTKARKPGLEDIIKPDR